MKFSKPILCFALANALLDTGAQAQQQCATGNGVASKKISSVSVSQHYTIHVVSQVGNGSVITVYINTIIL